jgi:hypothetical protein
MELITKHAAVRMQQRGIKDKTLDCLLKFGSKIRRDRGCFMMFFDKQARNRLQKIVDSNLYIFIQSQIDAYAIVSANGEVLTVGHRFRRINRH